MSDSVKGRIANMVRTATKAVVDGRRVADYELEVQAVSTLELLITAKPIHGAPRHFKVKISEVM